MGERVKGWVLFIYIVDRKVRIYLMRIINSSSKKYNSIIYTRDSDPDLIQSHSVNQ